MGPRVASHSAMAVRSGLGIGDVARETARPLAKFGGHGLRRRGGPPDDGHPRPRRVQRLGDAAADAARAPGDERGATG